MDRALLLSIGLCLLAYTSAFTPQRTDEMAVRSDVQYIRCGVCEALAKNVYLQIEAVRDELKKPSKLSEIEVLEKIELMTDPVSEEGEWIRRLDLVESGGELVLEEHTKPGVCRAKCKTIARAAQDILGDHDTDLGELLWKGNRDQAGVTDWLCKETTTSCTRKPPPLPCDHQPGVPFKEIDLEELNMQRMMAAMQGTGMKSNLYSRDEAARMAGFGVDGGAASDSNAEEHDGGNYMAAGTSTATENLLSKLQETLTNAAYAVRDVAGSLVEKVFPVMGIAWGALSSVAKAVSNKINLPKQMQPPHGELSGEL